MPESASSGQAVRPHALPNFMPVYLTAPDAESMPWKTWRKLFKLHLVGTGLSSAGTDLQRLACLYQSLGAKKARISEGLCPETVTFDDTMTMLEHCFGDRQSLIFARTRFNQRSQHETKDIFSFLTELRKIATCWIFGAEEYERLRDRLVAGCSDERVRERPFMQSTLARLRRQARSTSRTSIEGSVNYQYPRERKDTNTLNLLRRGHSSSDVRIPRDASGESPSQHSHHWICQNCPNCGREHERHLVCPAMAWTRGPATRVASKTNSLLYAGLRKLPVLALPGKNHDIFLRSM